ncbi:MAG TPA: zinc-binding alcohol dehydrogenase family protein [Telluria sp.]|nr:zinc-binding alcohol dehydrogenase family protein [Telluria sp.]
MKAIGVASDNRLHDLDLPQPQTQPQGRDLLVDVQAISVNPVDYKQRRAPRPEGTAPRVLGYDAAGVVRAAGPDASLFRPGDRVYYAGSIDRPGTNSELHLVDERIVGHAPATLSAAEAAALPLTAITAWEALFERLAIPQDGSARGRTLLVLGGAGGVASIAIQLARQLAGMTVLATASRPASAAWVRDLGAQHVLDHHGDLPAQLRAAGLETVDYILCTNALDRHFAAIAAMIAPQGKICSIVRNEQPLPMELLFAKSASFAFELMFTRSSFGTADMSGQHALLEEVARAVDAGVLRTTLHAHYGPINAANLARAHAALESGAAIGKIVLEGW